MCCRLLYLISKFIVYCIHRYENIIMLLLFVCWNNKYLFIYLFIIAGLLAISLHGTCWSDMIQPASPDHSRPPGHLIAYSRLLPIWNSWLQLITAGLLTISLSTTGSFWTLIRWSPLVIYTLSSTAGGLISWQRFTCRVEIVGSWFFSE